MSVTILPGDCLDVMGTMPDASVQMCVTSPPYWGLRDYGVAGQLGLERTPDEYVARMVAVFREVKRVLRDDGTLWLNLGDSYASIGGGKDGGYDGGILASAGREDEAGTRLRQRVGGRFGLKAKDLVGIPWRVAFALQADGWYLRSDIIWAKPNPMPESVTDRPTKAHEYLFLLAKSPTYYYDAAAIAEPAVYDAPTGTESDSAKRYETLSGRGDSGRKSNGAGYYRSGNAWDPARRNRRSVWTVATQPFREAHFATFPPKLIEPCILAGSARGDTVLDPFGGAGTTGLVADRLGRNAVLIELNPEYAAMARARIDGDAPLFAEGA